ncbi:Crp/Fnr family transcriptional regulator [Actinosynnema sp. NPDC050436]|uniref:Crp/Fnr family transcriptional regulator n=1 Tax=Actinosynnema sp. NPDC050436 TaxID=3155659 RepID=UPI00340E388A
MGGTDDRRRPTLNREPWPAHSLLGGMRARDREALLGLGTEVGYRPHQRLLRQGEDHRHAMLVLAGHVKVMTTSEFGRDLLVDVSGPGDLLGEMAVLENERRAATVIAGDHTTVRVVPGAELEDFLERHGEACVAVARMLSRRLRRLHDRCADLVVCPAPTRVARVLVDLVGAHGRRTAEGWALTFPLPQHELASLAGVALTTVEKALRDLRDDGVLGVGSRRIVITDLAGLRRIGLLDG